MTNRAIFHTKNYIELIFAGNQTQETVANLIKQSGSIIDTKHLDRLMISYLVDITKLGQTTAEARNEAAKMLQERPFYSIGIVGSNLYEKYLSSLIVIAAGKERQVRYFENRKLAIAWINHLPNRHKNR